MVTKKTTQPANPVIKAEVSHQLTENVGVRVMAKDLPAKKVKIKTIRVGDVSGNAFMFKPEDVVVISFPHTRGTFTVGLNSGTQVVVDINKWDWFVDELGWSEE